MFINTYEPKEKKEKRKRKGPTETKGLNIYGGGPVLLTSKWLTAGNHVPLSDRFFIKTLIPKFYIILPFFPFPVSRFPPFSSSLYLLFSFPFNVFIYIRLFSLCPFPIPHSFSFFTFNVFYIIVYQLQFNIMFWSC